MAIIEGEWGESLRLTGDLAGAIRHLRSSIASLEALQAWSDAGKAQALLGRAYGMHGQAREFASALKRAEDHYERAGDMAGVVQVRIQRAVLEANFGQRKQALATLSEVHDYVSANRAPFAVRLRMAAVASAYLSVREYAKAAETGESVLREFPNRAPAATYWILSAAYFHLGRYGDAVQVATCGHLRCDRVQLVFEKYRQVIFRHIPQQDFACHRNLLASAVSRWAGFMCHRASLNSV